MSWRCVQVKPPPESTRLFISFSVMPYAASTSPDCTPETVSVFDDEVVVHDDTCAEVTTVGAAA
jgi:hypothetical protein